MAGSTLQQAARLIATGGGCDRGALSQTCPRLAWSGRKLRGHFNLAMYCMYRSADGLMGIRWWMEARIEDHDEENQRRSCDARLLGKGGAVGAYAIIIKAHCPNSGS